MTGSFQLIASNTLLDFKNTIQVNNPVLIRIETKAGHGAGKPTEKIIEEISDKWAFVFDEMKVTPQLR